MSARDEKIAATFAAAGFDVATLTRVPATSIHTFAVDADGYLDTSDGVLMFAGETPNAVAKFMYYIGEEANRNVRGVGVGIAAWDVSDERAEWLIDRVEAYAKRSATKDQ